MPRKTPCSSAPRGRLRSGKTRAYLVLLFLSVRPGWALGASDVYREPEPEKVRNGLREVMDEEGLDSQPKQKGMIARFLEKVQRWLRRAAMPSGMGTFAEIVLALLGIGALLLLGLALWLAIRAILGNRRKPFARVDQEGLVLRREDVSHDQLLSRAMALSDRGHYVQALGALLSALLKGMAEAGRLQWDQSKTNGQYLREYPVRQTDRDAFGRFVSRVEQHQYRWGRCSPEQFKDLYRRFEELDPIGPDSQ